MYWANKPYQKFIDRDGYRQIWLPWDDPYCPGDKRKNKKYGGRWEREHRWIMAKHLGRRLKKGETVHHINGKRAENRISNLELWTGRHGKGVRVADQVREWLNKATAAQVTKLLSKTKHAKLLRSPQTPISCPFLPRSPVQRGEIRFRGSNARKVAKVALKNEIAKIP